MKLTHVGPGAPMGTERSRRKKRYVCAGCETPWRDDGMVNIHPRPAQKAKRANVLVGERELTLGDALGDARGSG